MILFIAYKIIPSPKKSKTGGSVNYAPDGYKKTIEQGIDGIVRETNQSGLFWVTVDDKKLPFSYDIFKLPKNWEESYPEDFIQVGDSIFKKANNDTFYLVRGNIKYCYILPR
jgi:hypothetical protein